ncbi:hypothetical protein HHI36_006236 [Cryptolaemus montrouzieri]|uniref:Uncharacterized protein n=1 Tax=Cryptolaemus montrouzieri TaxID=559131 RepID=A0ABD2NWJ7_9CUCU
MNNEEKLGKYQQVHKSWPKCANCGGEHLSSNVNFPKNPKNRPTEKLVPAPAPPMNFWTKRAEEKKAADQAKRTEHKDDQKAKEEKKTTDTRGIMMEANDN